MGKIEYSRWIEGVKERFKVGQKVALAVIPPKEHIKPWILTISYIEEDHNQVRWDNSAYQPAAITLMTETGVCDHRAPSTLRPLTEEEEALVKLQNIEPSGSA